MINNIYLCKVTFSVFSVKNSETAKYKPGWGKLKNHEKKSNVIFFSTEIICTLPSLIESENINFLNQGLSYKGRCARESGVSIEKINRIEKVEKIRKLGI